MHSDSKLNWLRAAVLGANDGITSVASIVVGVAGAIADVRTVVISGVAGLLAGAFSMAAGEYVSVSSQRDAEKTMGFDPHKLVNPWQAAFASFVSFSVGGIIPLLSIILPPEAWRIPATFVAAIVAMAITGALSAWVSQSRYLKVMTRIVLWGALAMVITYGIGKAFGVAGL
jgi:VIT1/CCC1 family predicted Fe2+/Mn2+ transporter